MNIVFLTGAGMSQESGISTFRDSDGLWENHAIEDVASPEGFARNPALVLNFYNARRKQLFDVKPNLGHNLIAQLQSTHQVSVITQNVDDLHERAGSQQVLHLHGELRKVRSTSDSNYVIPWTDDLKLGDCCPQGSQLRPHIVWFGEAVPAMDAAIPLVQAADRVVVIGTSMQVYPAASLIQYTPQYADKFYIDPRPAATHIPQLEVISMKASEGLQHLMEVYF